jgi:hypothetical protein
MSSPEEEQKMIVTEEPPTKFEAYLIFTIAVLQGRWEFYVTEGRQAWEPGVLGWIDWAIWAVTHFIVSIPLHIEAIAAIPTCVRKYLEELNDDE